MLDVSFVSMKGFHEAYNASDANSSLCNNNNKNMLSLDDTCRKIRVWKGVLIPHSRFFYTIIPRDPELLSSVSRTAFLS